MSYVGSWVLVAAFVAAVATLIAPLVLPLIYLAFLMVTMPFRAFWGLGRLLLGLDDAPIHFD